MRQIYFLYCFLGALLIQAQELSIKGTVTTSDGEPLIGASVIVKGKARGTQVEIDGSFRLTSVAPDDILVFSFIGFQNEETKVGNRSVIDIVLREDLQALEEVVVVGYGTQKRSTISGSVSVLKTEDLESTQTGRLEQAIQGKTSGIFITQNSGSPGSNMTVRIRGIGSINNSDPLYVVDGIPQSSIDYLNAAEVESISVLKDAASAAIYGARGANGVVLITTRSGSFNRGIQIDYSGYYGIQEVAKKVDLLNRDQYTELINEASANGGGLKVFLNPEDLPDTDWQDAIFEQAPIQNHTLTLQGGGPKYGLTSIVNIFSQDGIVGGDKSGFDRYSFRVNANFKPTERLSLGSKLLVTHSAQNVLPQNTEFGSPIIQALNMDPVTPVRLDNGQFAASDYAETDIRNPVNAIALNHAVDTRNRVVGSFFQEYEIIDGLKIRTNFGIDKSFQVIDIFTPEFQLFTPSGEEAAHESNETNTVSKQYMENTNWIVENVLSYNITLGKHNIDFLAGTSAQKNTFEDLFGTRLGLPSSDPDRAFLSASNSDESPAPTGDFIESSINSYFGRLSYNYHEKYLLMGNLRSDRSSKFGANNKQGLFPAISAGWVISQESFFPANPIIELLKLRASWGQNGNDRIGDYQFTSLIFSNRLRYTFGVDETTQPGAVQLQASNKDLKWESSEQTSFGLDLGLLNGKLDLTVDYYIKETQDMLLTVPVPGIAGVAPASTNAATMENKGLEFLVDFKDYSHKLGYSVTANLTTINNQVTSLGGGQPLISSNVFSKGDFVSLTDVGQPVASFYGWQVDGIFQSQSEIDAWYQGFAEPGDIRFKDIDDNGAIDNNDKTFIGKPIPDFIYGFNLGLTYGLFDFSAFVQGVHGVEILNAFTRSDFSFVNKTSSVVNRWTGEGSSNSEPIAKFSDRNRNNRISDRFIEDGSYMRIKNVQLGYRFSKEMTSKIKISSARIYLGVQNLHTFTSYSGLDPDIGLASQNNSQLELNVDRGFFPQSRIYTTGIDIKF